MVTVRTSTSYVSDIAQRTMMSAKGDIATLSKQITTGKYSDSYLELGANTSIESLLSGKAVKEELSAKVKNNSLMQNKMAEMERVVRSLGETIVKDSLKICMDANNPAIANTVPSASMAKQQLESIRGYLNASFNGEKIFAGSKTSVTDVVGDIVNNTNIVAGQETANYYNGDSQIRTEKISRTQDMAYGITADDSAIQRLIAAHHHIINGRADIAVDMLNQVKTELGAMVTILGEQSKAVSNQVEQDNKSMLKLDEAIGAAEDVDITDLLPKLSALEVQLKASFLLTSRVSELSLLHYLR